MNLLEMSNEELFVKAQEGDELAKNTLFEYNMRYCHKVARKYLPTGAHYDDLISAATLGLTKAFNSFSIDKGLRFLTYASRCIENEVLMYLRKYRKQSKDISIDTPMATDETGSSLTIGDTLTNDDHLEFDMVVDRDTLPQVMARFKDKVDDRLYEIFILRTVEKVKQREVADMYGISQSYVARLNQKAIRIIEKIGKEMINGKPKEDISMAKLDKTHLRHVMDAYKQLRNKDLATIFNVSEATISVAKREIEKNPMKYRVVLTVGAVSMLDKKVKGYLHKKQGKDIQSRVNELMPKEGNDNVVSKESTEVKEEKEEKVTKEKETKEKETIKANLTEFKTTLEDASANDVIKLLELAESLVGEDKTFDVTISLNDRN